MTEEFEIRPNLRLRRVEEMPDRTAVRPTQTFDELSIVKTHTEKNVENTILCQSVELRRPVRAESCCGVSLEIFYASGAVFTRPRPEADFRASDLVPT